MRTLALAMLTIVCACVGGPNIRVDSPTVAAYKLEVRELRKPVDDAVTAWSICHATRIDCHTEGNTLELAARSVGETAYFDPKLGQSQPPMSPRSLPPCLQSLNLELADSGAKLWAVTRSLFIDNSESRGPLVADAQRTFETVVAKIEATHC